MSGDRTFFVETLGCPKNQVDSDKLVGTLLADGMAPAASAEAADLVVVNTCAFIEEARQESIDVVLALADRKADGARLVVTGCMAERYGDELAEALPRPTRSPGSACRSPSAASREPALPASTSSACPGPPPTAPVGLREGGRGLRQGVRLLRHPELPRARSARATLAELLDEVDGLVAGGVREVVLVAQDLASLRPRPGRAATAGWCRSSREVADRVDRVRLLYLYPSHLDDALDRRDPRHRRAVLRPVAAARRARRSCGACGAGATATGTSRRIEEIRRAAPEAAFRSNFIVGYPGETEADHDQLLAFVRAARARLVRLLLLLAGGRHLRRRPRRRGAPPARGGAAGRAARAAGRASPRCGATSWWATRCEVLVDAPGVGRSHREAPEIDGIITVPGPPRGGRAAPRA